MTQRNILIDSSGRMFSATLNPIPNGGDLLRDYARSRDIVVPFGEGRNLKVGIERLVATMKVPDVILNTWVAPVTINDTAYLTPTWSEQTYSVNVSLKWAPPAGYELWIARSYYRGNSTRRLYEGNQTYLVLLKRGATDCEIFEFPAANIYQGSSAVCMGNNWENGAGHSPDSIPADLDRARQWINEARSNGDLSTGFTQMVYWNPATEEPAYPRAFDSHHLRAVSTSELDQPEQFAL